MKKSIDFFYKVAKEAGFAEDEDGIPSDCYSKIRFILKNPISVEEIEAERERGKDDAIRTAAEFLNIDASLLTIVSEEEYLSKTENDKSQN